MRAIILTALIVRGWAAGAPVAAQQAEPGPGSSVTVTRDGEVWTAEFDLFRDAPVWAFQRSALTREGLAPWRPAQWTVETAGVVLERQGHLDVLRTRDGGPVPRRVRLAMKPAAVDLLADYDPALTFTDGSVALYTGHFDVFPVESVEAAAALPLDLNGVETDSRTSRVTWSDRGGPVLFNGERRRDVVSEGPGTYVVFGQADFLDSPRLATVLDPGLPAWIGAEISDFAPRIASYYAERLGPGEADKPTVMVSWNGPTPGLRSMGGSVLQGLIIMAFEGQVMTTRTEQVSTHARWFIGHESAHFWLGQTVRYERARDAWITEGGADLMAVRGLSRLNPDYDARAALQREVDDCVALGKQPVASANERSEHRAYYACGAVFAMTAEGAQRRAKGGDWFDFLKPLIDASREDRVLTRDEWLDALDAVSGDASLRRDMEMLLDEGSPQPGEVVAGLLQRSGVAHRLESGRVVLD